MKNLFSVLFILVSLISFSTNAQNFTISGTVKDANNGEYIIGANVYIKELGKGMPTNVYGFYSITIPAGKYIFVCSSIGFETQEQIILLDANKSISLELKSSVILTDIAEVVGNKNENTDDTQMGRVKLEVDKIKSLPAFLGEVDILKTIQFLPGIQSAGEGNTGFYVRGGGPDQNLILLDNAVVYNASHLFGFFSVFNADAVKNVEVIKGGMPANYGGRLASVLDISLKEGNSKEYEFEGGIGLIASRFTAQGPLKKDVSSFIVSGRRTYIDVLSKPLINPESAFAGTGYYFYDLNMKVNYKLSDKDQLFLSGYFGRDVFGFKSSEAGFSADIPWGNATSSLRWNHLVNDKLFLNTIVTFSDYQFSFQGSQEDFEFELSSGIRDWSVKSALNYYPNLRHRIQTGLEYVYHRFAPSSVTARSGDVEFDTGDKVLIYAHELALYAQDEYDISDKLRINGGLRFSLFDQVGPFTRYLENENGSVFQGTEDPEKVEYSKGESVALYTNLEPRLSMRYTLDANSSIKAGYTRNYQYLHLASLSPTSLPTDVWLPSTDVVQPQAGTQYSIGYFRNFKQDSYESSVEIYYKTMENLVEFEEGASPENNINNNADNQLVFGDGYSYGLEVFFKKRVGKLNGWIGYTLSKTNRKFPDLNEGREFPARYDRRHDLSIIGSYQLTSKWQFGAAFVYGTGNAITLPVARYFVEGQVVSEYGDRNSFRMDPYHRADISATYTPSPTKKIVDPVTGDETEVKRRFISSWSFSVYNVYSRMNPYFIYFGTEGSVNEGNLQIKAYQVSLFPILPSATWNFSF